MTPRVGHPGQSLLGICDNGWCTVDLSPWFLKYSPSDDMGYECPWMVTPRHLAINLPSAVHLLSIKEDSSLLRSVEDILAFNLQVRLLAWSRASASFLSFFIVHTFPFYPKSR